MSAVTSLDEVLELADQLSLEDKLRLIEKLAPRIAREVQANSPRVHTSFRGLWKGHSTSEEDLATARAELWRDFPRNDI